LPRFFGRRRLVFFKEGRLTALAAIAHSAQDVRGVNNSDTGLVTCSRDKTIRLWTPVGAFPRARRARDLRARLSAASAGVPRPAGKLSQRASRASGQADRKAAHWRGCHRLSPLS